MAAITEKRHPNILLLFADQQRHDTLGGVNAPFMRTPNLNRLAREGCTFRRAYSPNPVCMPARHGLLTGRTSRRHGYTVNRDHVPIADYGLMTLPRLLQLHGYVTAGIGKMHFWPKREHHGFDEMHLMEELPHYREEDAYLRHLAEQGFENVRHIHGVRHILYHEAQRSLLPIEHHGSTWAATRTIQFIRENRNRPFFCWTGWVHPHPPCALPDEFRDLYRDAALPSPVPPNRPPNFAQPPCSWYGDADEPVRNRRLREAYFGAISLIDYNVGRILQCLEETGLAENTIVVYTSDHGEMLGDRGLYQKMLPYDASARIPFIVRWPGRIPGGSVCNDFVDLLDLLPTFAQAAGVDAPTDLPGRSFLRDDGIRGRDSQWVEGGQGRQRWIMQLEGRWKYVFWYNGGWEELYDLEADPLEQRNLAADGSGAQSVLRKMRERCFENEMRLGVPANVQNGRPAALPMQPFPPHAWSRYPLWANDQFPDWGDKPPREETALMEKEIIEAIRGLPDAPPFHQIFDGAEWRERWRETWRRLGGRPEFYEFLFHGKGLPD